MSRPADWSYLSEGGANVVFRYTGPPHADFTSHVLRLRKRTSVGSLGSSDSDFTADLAFWNEVIRPLLGEKLLPDCRMLKLDEGFLRELAERAEPHRPPLRRSKGGLDTAARRGMLVTDLTGRSSADEVGELLAVEIKPKWGFLPSPVHLSSTTRTLKTIYCRTCMHRQLKLDSAHASSTSGAPPSAGDYCPLDLYSGDNARMSRAVGELWKGWMDDTEGKGNSLRLFVNGVVVRASDTSPLCRALGVSDNANVPSLLATHLLPALQRSTVLARLASLQATLDPLDVEGLLALPSLDPTAVNNLSMRIGPDEYAQFSLSFAEGRRVANWDDKQCLIAFLIAASLKDCSIIARIPLPPSAPSEPASPSSSPPPVMTAASEVKVIDLDPKPSDRLGKWAALDAAITSHFSEHVTRVGEDAVRKCCER